MGGGAQYQSYNKYLSGNVSLRGTLSTGMTVSDKTICILEDPENSYVDMRTWIWGKLQSHAGQTKKQNKTKEVFLSCSPTHVLLQLNRSAENKKPCDYFLLTSVPVKTCFKRRTTSSYLIFYSICSIKLLMMWYWREKKESGNEVGWSLCLI